MFSYFVAFLAVLGSCLTVFKESVAVGVIRQLCELITMLYMMKVHGYFTPKFWSVVDMMESRFDEVPCTQFISVETGEEVSTAQVDQLANKFAHWGHDVQQLKQKNTVCLMLHNRPEFVSFWIGMAKIGVSTALLNTNITGKPLLHSVEVSVAASEHKLLVIDDDIVETLSDDLVELRSHGVTVISWSDLQSQLSEHNCPIIRPPKTCRDQIKESDPVIFIFTSGTTGLPKAAKISSTRMFMMTLPFRTMGYLGLGSRIYCVLPLYHAAGGVSCAVAALLSGATVVLRKRFSATSFAKDCHVHKCDSFQYIGELCRFLINAPDTELDSKLNLKYCIGNGMRADVWAPFQKRYKIGRVIEFYSATEANVGLFNSTGKMGSLGLIPRVLDFIYPVKILKVDPEQPDAPLRDPQTGFCSNADVDETGLVINIISTTDPLRRFDGYSDTTATNKKILRNVFTEGDMYFNSGDLLHRDWFGFFYWADRVGDTFRWKGENIATTEVENVLDDVDFIADLCVYGVQIPQHDGRCGMVSLTLKDGPDGLSRDIRSLDWTHYHQVCSKNLPSYSRPVFIRVMKSLPQTVTFKHQKTKMVKDSFTLSVLQDGEGAFMYNAKTGAVTEIDHKMEDAINAGTVKF